MFLSLNSWSQETIEKKWRFAFQLDNRFSKIRGNEVTIFGAKAGLQYRKKVRFGIGTSFIINPVTISYYNKRAHAEETNVISFWYVSAFGDYIIYRSKNWECFLTEQLGFGTPSFKREINNDVVSDANVNLYVNEVSGQINYKVNHWIGLGVGVGHRDLLNKASALKATFDSPIYIAKIIIYPETFFEK